MKFGQLLWCVPQKRKVAKPKKSCREKTSASTAARKPNATSNGGPISRLLRFLRRKNKVHIQAEASKVPPPGRCSSNAANFVSKTQSPKDDEQPCSCDCTSGSTTEEDSVEKSSAQAVACTLLARNIRRCEPKSRRDSVKKSIFPRLNGSQRPPTKYNQWTLPSSSHPLSRRRYSALYYVKKGTAETAGEGEATESQDTSSCVPESSLLCEVERREEEPASQEASAICPSGPSIKPVTPSTDSITQHCRVNMDTDFIANFSYAFFHGNDDSGDTVTTCSQIATVKLDTDTIANVNYDFMHDDII